MKKAWLCVECGCEIAGYRLWKCFQDWQSDWRAKKTAKAEWAKKQEIYRQKGG